MNVNLVHKPRFFALLHQKEQKKQQQLDEKEFEQAAPQLCRRAIAAARGCGLGSDEAEDVAQDVLLKLWSLRADLGSARGQAPPGAARVEALAYVAARNMAVDRLRRRRTVALPDRPVEDDRHAQPDTLLEIADNERWLERKLGALPSTEYQVLHLRQVERRSDEEIAAILSIPVASVPTLLSRARRRLLEAMARRK